MAALEDAGAKLKDLRKSVGALLVVTKRRLAACAREHAAQAKRATADGDKTKWGPPVFEPWLGGETPHDPNPGGAAGNNRRARPGADENPAPHGGT